MRNLQFVWFFVAIGITLVITAAVDLPATHLNGWNELLFGKGIFSEDINDIQYKSSDHAGILGQLEDLLNDRNVLQAIYKNYKQKYGKNQTPTAERLNVFKQKLFGIAAHNLLANSGSFSWWKGVNQFTDVKEAELNGRTSGSWDISKLVNNSNQTFPNDFKDEAPDSLNFLERGRVSSVKDQGDCASCAMFAAAALVESVEANSTNRCSPLDLSTQELMDCAVEGFKCSGPGASIIDVLTYVQNNGIARWTDYSYQTPAATGECRKDSTNRAAQISGFEWIVKVDENDLKQVLFDKGPLATLIVGYTEYEQGIYDGQHCGSAPPAHAVLLTGYGKDQESGLEYWLLKNSYGPNWGEDGYMRLLRNNNHVCQIGNYNFAATAKKLEE